MNNLIFSYGTLKQGHANHYLMEDLISQNDAVLVGQRTTRLSFPLVVGPHGVAYLINIPGSGQRVRGELYFVSDRGLVRLDELEGTRIGHYERLPIEVENEGGNGAVSAEAYFAHRSFGERLWERKGSDGLSEFGQNDAVKYVRPEDRPKGAFVLDDMEAFLSSPID